MHGDRRRRTAKNLAGALVVLVLCAALLAVLFVGGRLWWMSFHGPEASPPAAAVTAGPEPSVGSSAGPAGPSAPAKPAAIAPEPQAPTQASAGAPATPAGGKPVTSAGTASVRLAWDKAPDENVTGYRILFGTQSGLYSGSMSVGNQTKATLTGLERGTKYYVVTIAVDAQGNQSRPSNEIEVVAGK